MYHVQKMILTIFNETVQKFSELNLFVRVFNIFASPPRCFFSKILFGRVRTYFRCLDPWFNSYYFTGLEMDCFRFTILCSSRSFCCSRRNLLRFRFVRRHLLTQMWIHARSDLFKRTHFTWQRYPLDFAYLMYHYLVQNHLKEPIYTWYNKIPVVIATLVAEMILNRWKERVIKIIKDAVKIEQEFYIDELFSAVLYPSPTAQ